MSSPEETDLSELHLAIINKASPNDVEIMLCDNPQYLNLKTSNGRTAMDIASTMEDSADSIAVMKSFQSNMRKSTVLEELSKSLIQMTLAGEEDTLEKPTSVKDLWQKAGNAVIFVNRLTASLGPAVELDMDDSVKIPDDFEPPASLKHKCVDVTLPVGFRQIRWALLNSQSKFNQDFHEEKMSCTK
jgi:hypothetical protein